MVLISMLSMYSTMNHYKMHEEILHIDKFLKKSKISVKENLDNLKIPLTSS